MSVNYRFFIRTDVRTITLDGLHISLKELKRQIRTQERLQPQKCDLKIRDAKTRQEYADDEARIPKGSSVIVRCVPVGGVVPPGRKRKRTREDSEPSLDRGDTTPVRVEPRPGKLRRIDGLAGGPDLISHSHQPPLHTLPGGTTPVGGVVPPGRKRKRTREDSEPSLDRGDTTPVRVEPRPGKLRRIDGLAGGPDLISHSHQPPLHTLPPPPDRPDHLPLPTSPEKGREEADLQVKPLTQKRFKLNRDMWKNYVPATVPSDRAQSGQRRPRRPWRTKLNEVTAEQTSEKKMTG